MDKHNLFFVLCFLFLAVALLAWMVTDSIAIGTGFAAAAFCFLGVALNTKSDKNNK